MSFRPQPDEWDPGSELRVELSDHGGAVLASQTWAGNRPAPGPLRARVRTRGWHAFRVTGITLPAPKPLPFKLTVTYTSTQTLGGP